MSEQPGRTALVVLLDELAPAVAAARAELDPVGARRIGLHVTLLHPFIARAALTAVDVAGLRAFFADRALAPFSLSRVLEFPDVVAYAAPEPAVGLEELTRAVWDEFPDFPPYGGTVDRPVPHATLVSYSRVDASLAQVRARLEPALPARCAPTSVSLVEEYEPDRWRELERLPLGAPA